MRMLVTALIAALLGAAGFHAYYRSLSADARCGWDYPFDDGAKERCQASGAASYSKQDREKLDDLIGKVAR